MLPSDNTLPLPDVAIHAAQSVLERREDAAAPENRTLTDDEVVRSLAILDQVRSLYTGSDTWRRIGDLGDLGDQGPGYDVLSPLMEERDGRDVIPDAQVLGVDQALVALSAQPRGIIVRTAGGVVSMAAATFTNPYRAAIYIGGGAYNITYSAVRGAASSVMHPVDTASAVVGRVSAYMPFFRGSETNSSLTDHIARINNASGTNTRERDNVILVLVSQISRGLHDESLREVNSEGRATVNETLEWAIQNNYLLIVDALINFLKEKPAQRISGDLDVANVRDGGPTIFTIDDMVRLILVEGFDVNSTVDSLSGYDGDGDGDVSDITILDSAVGSWREYGDDGDDGDDDINEDAKSKLLSVIKLLLAMGAIPGNVDAVADIVQGSMPVSLYLDYQAGRYPDIFMEPRLAAGESFAGIIALFVNAIKKEDDVIINYLLKWIGKLNVVDNKGYTLLMHAAGGGYERLVRILIDAGADISIENSDGKTAQEIASENRHSRIADLVATERSNAFLRAAFDEGVGALINGVYVVAGGMSGLTQRMAALTIRGKGKNKVNDAEVKTESEDVNAGKSDKDDPVKKEERE